MICIRLFLINSIVFFSKLAVAQIELPAIQLDRPDLTESPFLTPRKYLQMENGFMLEKEKSTIIRTTWTTPTTLCKYGISETFELRLVTTFSQSVSPVSKNVNGMAPVYVGFKSKLLKEEGICPEMSFIGQLAFGKIASKELQLNYNAPQFRFVMQHTLSKKVSLSYNLGMEWDGSNTLGTYIYTCATGISLNNKFGCFFEFFGDYNSILKANHNFDAGITYLINNNSMLDFSAGLSLMNQLDYQFLSCGYSFRLNTKRKK